MTVNFLPGKPCKSVLVSIDAEELAKIGLSADGITLQNETARGLLGNIFAAVGEICGCLRDGNYVTVDCRPLRQGGCRFLLQFTDRSSGRLFEFAQADDLLDALIQLEKNGECDASRLIIDDSGGNYKIYIPANKKASENALAILLEYAL